MLEKLTESARQVLSLARQEARKVQSGFIGPEHILIAILQEGGGIGAKVLKRLGGNPAHIRQEIEKLVTPSASHGITLHVIPFSPFAKRAIEHAAESASQLGHDVIGTEHLLLGLLKNDEGIAAKVLNHLGFTLEDVRDIELQEYRGFEIRENILSKKECDDLAQALSSDDAKRSRAGLRHLMSHPVVAELARDSRLLEIADCWVGPEAIPYRATLFEKDGDRNWLVIWHQDTTLPLAARLESPEWGPWSKKAGVHYAHAPAWALSRIIALRIHLDPSTPENGPLRVIPGSHVRGVLSDEEVFRLGRERKAVDCLAGRGAVLAMRPLLIHASSKARSRSPRRVLHVEYAASLELLGVRLAIA